MRILLIEDNQADTRLIRELLQELGSPAPELLCADRLSKGLEILAETKIDVVLLDLSLPDSHGLETLYQAQDRCDGVPIVVLTGNNEEMLAIKAVRQGAQDYLLKNEVSGPSLWRSTCYAVERARTLARWEESYRIVQHLPTALYVYSSKEWRVVYSNKRFGSLVGTDDGAIFNAGLPLAELIHPDDIERFKQERKLAFNGRGNAVFESRFRIKTAKQSWQWMQTYENVYVRSNAGLPELILGIGNPIPESLIAGDDAASELELLRTITDSLTEAVFVKDVTGHFTYSNATYRRALGVKTAAEVVGKTDFDFLPRALALNYHEKEQQVLQAARIEPDQEEPWLGRNGAEAWRLITRAPLRDAQGRVSGLLGISRDITREKQTDKRAPLRPGAAPDALSPKLAQKATQILAQAAAGNAAAPLHPAVASRPALATGSNAAAPLTARRS